MSIKLNLKKLENNSKSFKVSEEVDYDYLRFKAVFANEIFQYRNENLLLQEALGDILGISQEMISKYESAREDLSIRKFCEVKEKLNLDIELELVFKEKYIVKERFSANTSKNTQISINLDKLGKVSSNFIVHEDVDMYYKKLLSRIGSKIYTYRKENKYSQKDLGELLNVSQAMISKYESGNYNFSIKKLYELSHLMNFSVNIRKPLFSNNSYRLIESKFKIKTLVTQYDEVKILTNIINKIARKNKAVEFLTTVNKISKTIYDEGTNIKYCIDDKSISGYISCLSRNKGGDKYGLC